MQVCGVKKIAATWVKEKYADFFKRLRKKLKICFKKSNKTHKFMAHLEENLAPFEKKLSGSTENNLNLK